MSTVTVARLDFRSIRRSYIVVGVITLFPAIAALAFVGSSDVHPHPYRTLWDFTALTAWVFPLFAAPLTYLAIAGDRSRGTITYYLGLPNSRADYFLAKYLSRTAVAVASFLLAVGATFVVAAVTYEYNPDPVRFLTFGALSTLFVLSMVGIFFAISAVTASRGRAMIGTLGAYFVLSVFWLGPLPAVSVETLFAALDAIPGITLTERAQAFIASLSPAGAYFNTTPLVWDGVLDQYEVFAPLGDQPDYFGLQAWWNVVVMLAWSVLAPLSGYLLFRNSELS